ncbi:MAG: ornithine carbamoyltransferase [Actinomycetota bacterium]
MTSLFGRDFLKEVDFTAAELDSLIDLAATLKVERAEHRERPRLTGSAVALIFEKSSTRTRCAFEVAAFQQGAFTTYLDPASSQMGHKESIADTARVLSRMYDGIQYRGAAQATAEELAEYATVPVFNGLTDEWHPTQMLADFLTIREHAPRPWGDITYTYLGDARNNMGNSYLVMGAIMGADVRICAPRALWPADDVQALARERARVSGARILITESVEEAVAGADFLATDVWVSMGEPAETWAERIEILRPYRLDSSVVWASGNPEVKILHCLPAFHDTSTQVGRTVAERYGMTDGVEISHEVFESPASIVMDEAENRLHTIKAVLVATLARNP